jgi:hypothetical protein
MGPAETLDPAANVAFLAALEALRVDHACRACWTDTVTGINLPAHLPTHRSCYSFRVWLGSMIWVLWQFAWLASSACDDGGRRLVLVPGRGVPWALAR